MSVTLNRVGGTFVSGGEPTTSVDGNVVPTEESQRTVLAVRTGLGAVIHLLGTALRGLRVDARRAVTTSVFKVLSAAGAVEVRPANSDRQTIKIHFDAPDTERVFIREGGGEDDITNDNWSIPLWGGETYEPAVVSDGIYQAWWEDQSGLPGVLRVTEG